LENESIEWLSKVILVSYTFKLLITNKITMITLDNILLWIRKFITTFDNFSEDIDLAINREFFGFSGDISRTQVGKLKDVSSKYISNDFLFSLQKAFDDEGFKGVKLLVVDKKAPDARKKKCR